MATKGTVHRVQAMIVMSKEQNKIRIVNDGWSGLLGNDGAGVEFRSGPS